jgi:hypothetical protein
MGRAGRAGDRWRGHAMPPRRARGPARRSATHLLRQSPPARRRPTTSSSHSGSASRRTVCGPASAAGQLMAALTHRPSGHLLHQRRLGDLPASPAAAAPIRWPSREVVAPAESVRDRIPQRPGVAGQGPAGARGHQPPSRAVHRAKGRGARSRSIHNSNTSSTPRGGPAAGASRSGGPPRLRLDGEVADLIRAMPRPSPARISSQRSGSVPPPRRAGPGPAAAACQPNAEAPGRPAPAGPHHGCAPTH